MSDTRRESLLEEMVGVLTPLLPAQSPVDSLCDALLTAAEQRAGQGVSARQRHERQDAVRDLVLDAARMLAARQRAVHATLAHSAESAR